MIASFYRRFRQKWRSKMTTIYFQTSITPAFFLVISSHTLFELMSHNIISHHPFCKCVPRPVNKVLLPWFGSLCTGLLCGTKASPRPHRVEYSPYLPDINGGWARMKPELGNDGYSHGISPPNEKQKKLKITE